MSNRRKLGQQEESAFKKGFYGAQVKLLLKDLLRYPASGKGPDWATWQPWAIRELRRALWVADEVVDSASRRATEAAETRRTKTSGVSDEDILRFRERFKRRNKGKDRGWKKAGAVEFHLSANAFTDLLRRRGIE